MAHLHTKRIYDTPADGDGVRILEDRFWPRGLSKTEAEIDHWMKTIAPSTSLRTWYSHDKERFDAFARRYREELHAAGVAAEFRDMLDLRHRMTLLTASRDLSHSHANVLPDYLHEDL